MKNFLIFSVERNEWNFAAVGNVEKFKSLDFTTFFVKSIPSGK